MDTKSQSTAVFIKLLTAYNADKHAVYMWTKRGNINAYIDRHYINITSVLVKNAENVIMTSFLQFRTLNSIFCRG